MMAAGGLDKDLEDSTNAHHMEDSILKTLEGMAAMEVTDKTLDVVTEVVMEATVVGRGTLVATKVAGVVAGVAKVAKVAGEDVEVMEATVLQTTAPTPTILTPVILTNNAKTMHVLAQMYNKDLERELMITDLVLITKFKMYVFPQKQLLSKKTILSSVEIFVKIIIQYALITHKKSTMSPNAK